MKKLFTIVMVTSLVFITNLVPGITKTTYTKDTIQGREVITELDTDSFWRNNVHELYFQTIPNNIGQYWYVPVTVIKGRNSGPKVLITTGVHGNELNGLAVTALLKQYLDPAKLSGTVIIVHGVNAPGLVSNVRGFKYSGSKGGSWEDLNRIFDKGKTKSADQKYATLLWNKLFKNNADYAIDLHTAGIGTHYSVFIYADFRNPEVATMAKVIGADIIKMDNGEPGSVETSFVDLGIPAITYELGASERYQEEIVAQATEGVINYLTYLGLLKGEVKKHENTFIGNEWVSVRTELGGYTVPKVKVNDLVKEGDLIFVQYDAFGNLAKEYKSPTDGKVVVVKHFPTNEPGDAIVRIIYYNPANETQILAE